MKLARTGNEEHRGLVNVRWTATIAVAILLSLMSLPTAAAETSVSSGGLGQNDTWSYTFDEEGTGTFWCAPHTWMTGQVEIVAIGTEGALSGDVQIEIDGYAFSPDNLTIEVGTTITWTNNDATTHTVELDLEGGEAPEGGMAMHGGSMSWEMFWDMAGWWGVTIGLVIIGSVAITIRFGVKTVQRGCDSRPSEEVESD